MIDVNHWELCGFQAITGDSVLLKFEKARCALEESLKRVENIVPQAISCQVTFLPTFQWVNCLYAQDVVSIPGFQLFQTFWDPFRLHIFGLGQAVYYRIMGNHEGNNHAHASITWLAMDSFERDTLPESWWAHLRWDHV